MGLKRGIPITTAGTQVCYAVETVAGTMPTTAKLIPDIKETPDMNPQPEQLETTDLSCTQYKTYTNGLKDLSGANAYVANLTSLLEKEWDAMCNAAETAKESGLALWIYVITPGLQTYAYTAEPARISLNARKVNSVNEVNVYLSPTGEVVRTDEKITVEEPAAA